MTFGYYLGPSQAAAGGIKTGTGSANVAASGAAGGGSAQLADVLSRLLRTEQAQTRQMEEEAVERSSAGAPAGGGDLAEVLETLRSGGGAAGGGSGGGGPGSADGTPAGRGDDRPGARGGAGGQLNPTAVTLAMGALAGTAALLNSRFQRMVTNTLAINSSLEEYNGQIAAANRYAEAAGIARAIRQGEVIGGGYSRLSEAQADYRDIITDFTAPFQALAMNLAASAQNVINRAIEMVLDDPRLRALRWAVEQINEKMGDGDDEMLLGRSFLSDLSDGKFDGFGTSYMNPKNKGLLDPDDPARNERLRRDIFGL